MNVLIVEDDKLLADLITQKFAQEKIETEVVIDAQEGLKVLKEKRPDLILLDLILPGMDGFEFLSSLKKNREMNSIPVIILSNLSSEDDIKRAMSLGAKDFITKADFSLSGILDRIKRFLGKPLP